MILKDFVPNAIRNKGKYFGKDGSAPKPAPAKPRTEIPGAIKTKSDVPKAIAKVKAKPNTGARSFSPAVKSRRPKKKPATSGRAGKR